MSDDDITKLIERMPKRVRAHVEALNAEIAKLKQQLDPSSKKPTSVFIEEYDYNRETKTHEHVRTYFPEKTAIRFQLGKRDDQYVEVKLMIASAGRRTLELRSGFEQVAVAPRSSNTVVVALTDFQEFF